MLGSSLVELELRYSRWRTFPQKVCRGNDVVSIVHCNSLESVLNCHSCPRNPHFESPTYGNKVSHEWAPFWHPYAITVEANRASRS